MADHDTHDHTGVTGVPSATAPNPTTIELGHASDTTLARVSAGQVSIEGNVIYRAGGTDVPVTDGGTGASSAASAATNLGLGTGDSPQFTAINLGHASDTTIARVSAGVISVEGKQVLVATTDYASAQTDTAATITTGAAVAIVDFEDVTFDPGSDITTGASWAYTAPTTGIYRVSAMVSMANSLAWSASTERGLLQLFKNGVFYRGLDRQDGFITAGAGKIMVLQGSTLISLTAGDTIDVRVAQNSGSNIALDGTGGNNYIDISRIA